MIENTYNGNSYGVTCAERCDYSGKGKPKYSGYLEIEIECLTPLHIGGGTYESKNNSLVKDIVYCDGKPVIPGSSLKGCIRAVAAAVSHSCGQDRNDKIMKCSKDSMCIVCSIFGTLGYASRVNFSEFKLKDNCEIITLKKKVPHTPKELRGERKFYYYTKKKTNSASINNANNSFSNPTFLDIKAVDKGTKFVGRIFFKELNEEQLSLLMFSLDLDQSFQMLLGGFRYDNMGLVKITPIPYEWELEKSPIELAKEYVKNSDCKCQIKKLRENNYSEINA